MFGGLFVVVLVVLPLFIPLAVVAVVRLATAGRSEQGRPESVVAALRGARATSMVSVVVLLGTLFLVALMAGAAESARLLSLAPLTASLGALAVIALGEMWWRRARTPRRSAPLNARSGSDVASGGWLRAWLATGAALLGLAVVCGVSAGRLRGQVWAANDAPPAVFPGWSTTLPQLLALAVVALAWIGVMRMAVLRPTVPDAEVADDRALRRATVARATRAALVGTLLTLGADLLLAGIAANGSDRVAGFLVVGADALGGLLVAGAFVVLVLPASRMPRSQPAGGSVGASAGFQPTGS